MTQQLFQMPLIEAYTFGSIIINGESHGDIKIYQGKITPWQYIKHHVCTSKDIEDIVQDVDILIMGIGYNGMVEVEEEAKTFMQEKWIRIIIKQTTEAIQEYNKLVKQGKKVATILHSTC